MKIKQKIDDVPLKIENSKLVIRKDTTELRPDVTFVKDVVSLNEPSWTAISGWYNVDLMIPRRVIRDKSGNLVIEKKPMIFTCQFRDVKMKEFIVTQRFSFFFENNLFIYCYR